MTERLPRSATAYIATLTTLALAALVDAYLRHPLSPQEVALLPLLLLMGMLSGTLKVPLTSHRKGHTVAHTTLGFIATLITLLMYGPFPGMLVAASTFLTFKKTKAEFYKKLFNVSAIIVTAWSTSQFLSILDISGLSPSTIFINESQKNIYASTTATAFLIFSVLFYHTVNSILLTTVIALSSKWDIKKSSHFLFKNIFWTLPTYLIAGCFIIMLVWILFNLKKEYYHVVPLCLVILPQPFFYLNNLRLHRERDDEREKRFQELESLYSSMVQAMGRAIEAKDRYTQEHIARVVGMSQAIGKQLGLPPDQLRTLEVGAALHDIGKIAIPDTILNKPGGLTDDEFTLVQGHVALGSEILAPVPFPPEVIEAVRFHHEKWNGTGYPHHLAGDSIPLVARIIAVADVYDALTSDRPYRPAWSHERALEHMRSEVGKHFNAEVFAAFEAALEENPQLVTTNR